MEFFVLIGQIVGYFLVLLALIGLLGFCYEAYRRSNIPNPPGNIVDIGGRGLHILCTGTGTPTIIWEAGGGSSSMTSRRIQSTISNFSRIFTYDRAGYGWSDSVSGPRSFDDIAKDLEKLLIAAEIPAPYILVGVSMGGLMIRRFAARNREKVAGIVLLDSAEELHVFKRKKMLRKMQASAAVSRWLSKFGMIRLIVKLFPSKVGIPSRLPDDEVREIVDDISSEKNILAATKEMAAYFQVSKPMEAIGGFGTLFDIPLRVVTHGRPFKGSQSFLEEGWVESQERLAALSSNSKLITAKKSGHAISLESPDIVVEVIRELVEEINSGQKNA